MKNILIVASGAMLAICAMFMAILFIIIKVEGGATFTEPNTFICVAEIIFALFLVVLGLWAMVWNFRQQKRAGLSPCPMKSSRQ